MQLENALAYAEYIMGSIPIDFFLLDELAFFVKENEPDKWLEGIDTISLGVRKSWVTDNVISTLKTIVPDVDIIPGEWWFSDNNVVPIRVTIVERNFTYLRNLDTSFHLSSSYLMPNPFKKYWQVRYLIK